jgi:perosamine synthetase
MIIPHSRPTIDAEDVKAVVDVVSSGMIAQGKKVEEFEDAVARFVGRKYAAAVSSGTSALHLALLALGVEAGDQVIMPSYVCASPYFAALQAGAVPRIVDVNLRDLNISPEATRSAVSSKIKAIVVPHMFGNPAELDELLDLGIPIIEDCAQSIGATYRKKAVGSRGGLAVFSFYATKMITTGEGGMVLTDERDLYEKVTELRYYDKKPLVPTRYNYRMTDFQAALGLSQLKKLKHFIEQRKRIASAYNEGLKGCNCKTLDINDDRTPAFYRYIIMLDRMRTVRDSVRKRGVMCEKPVYKPLHEYFRVPDCPNSSRAFRRALSIPIYPSLTDSEVKIVVDSLKRAV